MVAGRIHELVKAREIEGIADVNDESAGESTRLVVELKRDGNANVILNNLFKHTALQSTFSVNMVALVDGVPRTLNLRDMLVAYIAHQSVVVRRRSQYRLDEAEKLIRRALAIEPDDGFFIDSLGWVYYMRGDYPRAVEQLERAIEHAGDDPTVTEHLGSKA